MYENMQTLIYYRKPQTCVFKTNTVLLINTKEHEENSLNRHHKYYLNLLYFPNSNTHVKYKC